MRTDEEMQKESIVKMSAELLNKFSGQVEINEKGKLVTAYFMRPPYTKFLDDEEIKSFEDNVERASHQAKADGLMKKAPGLLNSMRCNCQIANFIDYFPIIRTLYANVEYLKPICSGLVKLISLLF